MITRPTQDTGAVNPEVEQPRNKFSAATEGKYTNSNDDTVVVIPNEEIYGIFDGMGGHNAGDVASRIAGETLDKEGLALGNLDPQEVGRKLQELLINASNRIREQARGEKFGMGTTASVVKVVRTKEGKTFLVTAQVGDSRVYVAQPQGHLEQITEDDDFIGNRLDPEAATQMRQVIDEKPDSDELTSDERFYFQRRNEIANSLGALGYDPKVKIVEIQLGSKILVTCDGIHDNLRQSEIDSIVLANKDVDTLADEIMQATKKRRSDGTRRSKQDDFSVIAVEVADPGKQTKPESGEELKSKDTLTVSASDIENILRGKLASRKDIKAVTRLSVIGVGEESPVTNNPAADQALGVPVGGEIEAVRRPVPPTVNPITQERMDQRLEQEKLLFAQRFGFFLNNSPEGAETLIRGENDEYKLFDICKKLQGCLLGLKYDGYEFPVIKHEVEKLKMVWLDKLPGLIDLAKIKSEQRKVIREAEEEKMRNTPKSPEQIREERTSEIESLQAQLAQWDSNREVREQIWEAEHKLLDAVNDQWTHEIRDGDRENLVNSLRSAGLDAGYCDSPSFDRDGLDDLMSNKVRFIPDQFGGWLLVSLSDDTALVVPGNRRCFGTEDLIHSFLFEYGGPEFRPRDYPNLRLQRAIHLQATDRDRHEYKIAKYGKLVRGKVRSDSDDEEAKISELKTRLTLLLTEQQDEVPKMLAVDKSQPAVIDRKIPVAASHNERTEVELRQMAEQILDVELETELDALDLPTDEKAEEKQKKFYKRMREVQLIKLIEQLRKQS